MAASREKLLTKIAEAFKDLADSVNSPTPRLEVGRFASACRLLSPLIRCLGIAFKFADIEFSAKVNDLMEISKSIDTLEALIDRDIKDNCGKVSCSNSRNLIRVKRSVDMVRVMFQQILARRGNSIIGPVSTAYEQVFGPYHGWAIRTAVSAAMYALPTKTQLLKKLNDNEASAIVQMQNYVVASSSVVQYIDNLFHSRESGDELLGLI
uniref:Putative ceramide-1-phosphate transfer protein-like n=1 Tax=Davidia involucrata TaxID=16924 RepID=A0A5B7C3Y5_DAVIN